MTDQEDTLPFCFEHFIWLIAFKTTLADEPVRIFFFLMTIVGSGPSFFYKISTILPLKKAMVPLLAFKLLTTSITERGKKSTILLLIVILVC